MRCKATPYALLLFALLAGAGRLWAGPPQTTYHIKVDQFGYFPGSRKVAVIADPQVGYNAAETFTPGTGANGYQVRRWSDDAVVFTGTVQAWNGGATHAQSGDRGWWFDFSGVTTPGAYYVFDLTNNVGSFRFEIGDQVYAEVLKQAMRTFYYQRLNLAKGAPYTDPRWADAAAYDGPGQDRQATSRFAKGDLSTARDLHGGWMDAGDVNKYTTFAVAPVVQLVEAYRINPGAFGDNYNIPESGNGLPDLLDEVKWELDFLKRMQDATGTGGFLLKVGVDNYNEVTPPSTDGRPKYYLPECTSATVAGCAMFAASGATLRNVPALSAYGADLVSRAEAAWARARVTTGNFTTWQTACDDGDIKSGDADNTAEAQLDNAFVAAVYLYEATGKAEYKAFAEANYALVNPYKINWWGPYWMPQQLALLRLTTLPGVSATVAANIRAQKANMDYQNSVSAYAAGTDLYRAHMDDAAYHWGHNQARANAGQMNLDQVTFGLNPARHALYRETAEAYLHWMHGVNPMGLVMLSNMYAYGAEQCANEIYHTWFTHGSAWDNALTSANGPAPGYVPGGPNKQYSGTLTDISAQPHQKAYKDWNSGWPDNSWEIAEPAIYYQAAYVMLLARLVPPVVAPPPADAAAPTAPANLAATHVTANSITLAWTAATDNVGVTGYDLYQGATLVQGNLAAPSYTVTGLPCATAYSFTVKARDAAGNLSPASNAAAVATNACPVLGTKLLYGDALAADWQDVSTGSTRNLANTSPVKTGGRSIRVNYQGNGTLSLGSTTGVVTSAGTQLRCWVYNTDKYGLNIQTESAGGTKSAVVPVRPARGKWVEVVVSLSQLGNPASIRKVTILNSAAAAVTVYFDEIQLTNVSAAQPAAGRLAAAGVPPGVAVKVFPNPAKDRVVVSVRTAAATAAELRITDKMGRTVWEGQPVLQAGTNDLPVGLLGLTPGVYYLRVITPGGSCTKALIVL